MPAPAWEDLDDFLDPDEFAVVATVRQGGTGAPRQLVGIFTDRGINPRAGEYEMDTTGPAFLAKATAAAGILRGDTLAVDGVTYDVLAAPRKDGTGLAVIELGARHG